MIFRYPFNILVANLNVTLQKVTNFLEADELIHTQEGMKIDDVFFIGPYQLVKDLIYSQNTYEKKSLRILVDEKRAKNGTAKSNKNILANGVYLPADYSGGLPFLMVYKRIPALDNKPVLISENYVKAGELVIVPETAEHFAVLFYNDGEKCEIPKEVKWFQWTGQAKNQITLQNTAYKYEVNHNQYNPTDFVDGRILTLNKPLTDFEDFEDVLLDWNNPTVQLQPIISSTELIELLTQLKGCDAWVRRTGENNILYTQETLDILEYSKKETAPTIFKTLIQKLQKTNLIKVVSKLSGLELTALREVYAFRMQSNEFITKHADSTLNGQLLVRFNWLLQSPTGRINDLRFWKGKNSETPITQFAAIPNSATIFYVGDNTPHDLTPLPENSDKDRFNIVLTFGHYNSESHV